MSGGARPLCSIAGQGKKHQQSSCQSLIHPGSSGLAWEKTSRLCFPGWGHNPAHLGMEIFISGCLVAQPMVPARPPGGLWDQQGWDQSWHSSTGVTRIGDKHPGTTQERVLGLSSCFALCLKILEPDKMGLEGGFSHGFGFFQVS